MTILLVSHSMDDVARYAEEVIVLHQGERKMEGSVEEVFGQRKLLEEMGLGLPTIRAFLYDLQEKGLPLPLENTVDRAALAIARCFSEEAGEREKEGSRA